MISQRCPKCSSKRVRRGYRRTSIFMKIFCRYHLLCDNCNWEFSGFALPGTVTSKPKRRSKKTKTPNLTSKNLENQVKSNADSSSGKGKRVKKKLKIKY